MRSFLFTCSQAGTEVTPHTPVGQRRNGNFFSQRGVFFRTFDYFQKGGRNWAARDVKMLRKEHFPLTFAMCKMRIDCAITHVHIIWERFALKVRSPFNSLRPSKSHCSIPSQVSRGFFSQD